MNEYFVEMTKKLSKKIFPHGYFLRDQKVLRNSAIFIYIVLSVVIIVCILFIALCIYGIIESLNMDYGLSAGVIPMIAVPLGLIGFSVYMIVAFAKRYGMSVQQWMEQYASRNALTIADMQKFDKQVVMPDTYLIRIAGKGKAIVWDVGTGLLTHDYIAFHGTVIRRDEVAAACFYDHIIYDITDYGRKEIHILHLGLISKRGILIDTEVKREAGDYLIKLLKQNNSPNMETYNGEVLSEKSFQSICTRIIKQHSEIVFPNTLNT